MMPVAITLAALLVPDKRHIFHLSPRLCPSTAGCGPPSMSSFAFCLLPSCSRWFSASLLCCLVSFYVVILLISSLSMVDTVCSAAFGPPIVLHSCYMLRPGGNVGQLVTLAALFGPNKRHIYISKFHQNQNQSHGQYSRPFYC